MLSANLNDDVGVVRGHAVVGEQGEQEWTKHTPLRGPCAEDPRGRVCCPTITTCGQPVQDPVTEGGV